MAHETYIGVNNIAQNVNKIWIGDNGVAKKVKRGYIGDANGKARKFYSALYYWNRYSLIIQYRWKKSMVGYSESRSTASNVQFTHSNRWVYYSREKPEPTLYEGEYVYYLPLDQYGSSSWWSAGYVISDISRGKVIYEIRKSDTQVDNGVIMGNVYVHTVRDSAGVFVEYVYDYNNSAYPNNAVLDGYYYSERVEYSNSQGDYIDQVTSENPSAYPDNGRGSDGYWYVKVES